MDRPIEHQQIVDGQLQQVGSVREIYENPADARLARFFGGTNFLPGFKRGQLVETGKYYDAERILLYW